MKSDDKKILIIDDEENMRHILSVLLKKAGYFIETATGGKEGLDKVKKYTFDFILCDVKMPDMGGMDFLRSFKGGGNCYYDVCLWHS